MSDSPQATSEQELLIRLDEKMTIWLDLFKEHRDAVRRDFNEVWLAINDLRAKQGELSDRQLVSTSQQQGAGWLLKLLLTVPGLAALLSVGADKVAK